MRQETPRVPSIIINVDRQNTPAQSQQPPVAAPDQTVTKVAAETRSRVKREPRNTIRMGLPHKQVENPMGNTNPITEEVARDFQASNQGLPFRTPTVQSAQVPYTAQAPYVAQPLYVAQAVQPAPQQMQPAYQQQVQLSARPSPKPGEVSRATNRKIISEMFSAAGQGQMANYPIQQTATPIQQTSIPFQQATPAAQPATREPTEAAPVSIQPRAIPTAYSVLWQQWADYYRAFPISPAIMPEVELRLVKSLDTALLSLGEQLPQNIADSIAACRDASQPFAAVAVHIENIRNFGYGLYTRLAQATRTAEDKAFLQSAKGQEALKKLPAYAHAYEAAPDELETAKKFYRERLRKATVYHLHTLAISNPPTSPKYANGKIAEYIFENTWEQIQKALKSFQLSDKEETELYQLLPVAIFPFHNNDTNGDIRSQFTTDQPIPAISALPVQPANPLAPPVTTDFREVIARALLKSRVLQLAAFGNIDDNMEFLWHYAGSMQPGALTFNNNENPGFALTYKQAGKTLDYQNFCTPIFSNDPQFFGSFVALAENNDKTGGVQFMVKCSMETRPVNKGTNIELSEVTSASLGKFNAKAFLGGAETKEESEQVVRVNTLGQAVDELNRLRAALIRQVAELTEELDQSKEKIGIQRTQIYQMSTQNATEQRRANTAETALDRANKDWKSWFVASLQMLLAKTGWLSKGLAKAIKEDLKKLGVDETSNSSFR